MNNQTVESACYFCIGVLFLTLLQPTRANFSDLLLRSTTIIPNSTMIVSASSTRTSPTATVYWTINGTQVYRITDSPSSTTKEVIPSRYEDYLYLLWVKPASTTVSMDLSINLQMFMDGLPIQVEDLPDKTNPIVIIVSGCPPDNSPGVLSNISHTPCGLDCNATFTCGPGYKDDSDPMESTCLANATWSHSIDCKNCSCASTINCNCGEVCSVDGSLQFGSNVLFDCEVGCLHGQGEASCNADCEWNITQHCLTVECPIPSSIDCGACQKCNFTTYGILEFGDSANLICPEGYNGNATAKCDTDGTLSVTQPCAPVVCVANGTIELTGSNYTFAEDQLGSYKDYAILNCSKDYVGSATAVCTQDGWTVINDNCASSKDPFITSSGHELTDVELAFLIIGVFAGGVSTLVLVTLALEKWFEGKIVHREGDYIVLRLKKKPRKPK